MSNTLETSTFQNIKVSGAELLKALRENKQKHDEIFASALEGYYKAVQDEIETKKTTLASVAVELSNFEFSQQQTDKKPVRFTTKLPIYDIFNIRTAFPENHEDDYARAIRMVELSAIEYFSLTESEFNRYVMNNWEWKEKFLLSSSQYVTGQAVSGLVQFSK